MMKLLLLCGIASSLLYTAMNIFIPMQWGDYSLASQTVSELSAIGAPTRSIWVFWGTVYTLLYAAFGVGVRMVAGYNRPLRFAGNAVIAHGLIGLFWPPMHLRGTEPTMTDTMHIVFTMATVLLMLLAMGFGAAAFGKRFRLFSIAAISVSIAFGILTGLDAPNIDANLPTPWIGVWERINIGVFILWVVVFSVILMRTVRHYSDG